MVLAIRSCDRSHVFRRYAAQLANLVPADPLAAAQCDAIFELVLFLFFFTLVIRVMGGHNSIDLSSVVLGGE